MHTAKREKLFPHNLSNYKSGLCACPTSSASTVYFFNMCWPNYGLVYSSNIRNSLDPEKADKLDKTYRFYRAEKDNQYNLLKLFELFFPFFQVLKILLLFNLFDKNFLQNCTSVLLFYFLLHRFFKGNVERVFQWV